MKGMKAFPCEVNRYTRRVAIKSLALGGLVGAGLISHRESLAQEIDVELLPWGFRVKLGDDPVFDRIAAGLFIDDYVYPTYIDAGGRSVTMQESVLMKETYADFCVTLETVRFNPGYWLVASKLEVSDEALERFEEYLSPEMKFFAKATGLYWKKWASRRTRSEIGISNSLIIENYISAIYFAAQRGDGEKTDERIFTEIVDYMRNERSVQEKRSRLVELVSYINTSENRERIGFNGLLLISWSAFLVCTSLDMGGTGGSSEEGGMIYEVLEGQSINWIKQPIRGAPFYGIVENSV